MIRTITWLGSNWSAETWRLPAAQAEMLGGAFQPAAYARTHVSQCLDATRCTPV